MIDKLIREGEGRKIDFKRQFYNLPYEKGELVKDIAAMANSSRQHEEDSVILFGHKDGEFFNVDRKYIQDESDIQQMVNSIIDPTIDFHIEETSHNFEGKNYNLVMIKIPSSTRKPHLVNKESISGKKKLYKNQCFVRRGSSTEYANRLEVAEMVHDADETINPIKRMISYIGSLQQAGQQIDTKDLEKFLYRDLIPIFHAPLVGNLDFIDTNDAGLSVHHEVVPPSDKEVLASLLPQAATNANQGDFELAKTLFEKIPHIKESYGACIVGGLIYSRLNDEEKAIELFERAIELEPNSIETNVRVAESMLHFQYRGEAILYFEKALAGADASQNEDIYKSALFNLGSIYFYEGVLPRAQDLMRQFLELHKNQDEHSRFANKVISATIS